MLVMIIMIIDHLHVKLKIIKSLNTIKYEGSVKIALLFDACFV